MAGASFIIATTSMAGHVRGNAKTSKSIYPSTMMREFKENLTAVIIAYRKKRLNHRLIFGEPTFMVRRGWRRQLAVFQPNQIFAYERWRADEYGTQDWRIFVCRARDNGSVTKVPGVLPGAETLLEATGKTKAKRALAAIDGVSKICSVLTSVPPHTWRDVHNSLQTNSNWPFPCGE